MDNKIILYNRQTGALEEEQVFERGFMDFFYGHPLGLKLSEALLKRKGFSRFYGWLQRHPRSRAKIQAFAARYGIAWEEVAGEAADFQCFDDFFCRQLKPAARPIDPLPTNLISPADARMLCHFLQEQTAIPVKGRRFSLVELTRSPQLAEGFQNGLCLVFRLAPVDYHRFGYIDDGSHDPIVTIPGYLHSVSPLALARGLAVFPENERQLTLLQTRHFGPVLEVEVGALVVGRIIQHQAHGGDFARGEEKGFFALGGSTVILILRADTVTIDADILHHSRQGIETLVRYGSAIGKRREDAYRSD